LGAKGDDTFSEVGVVFGATAEITSYSNLFNLPPRKFGEPCHDQIRGDDESVPWGTVH
jgi:hypothetical protein